MLKTIVKKGDPVLEKKCHAVTKFDDKLARLLDDMTQTLAQSGGVGLAAPQVGICRRGRERLRAGESGDRRQLR